jgi:hypothetical protein
MRPDRRNSAPPKLLTNGCVCSAASALLLTEPFQLSVCVVHTRSAQRGCPVRAAPFHAFTSLPFSLFAAASVFVLVAFPFVSAALRCNLSYPRALRNTRLPDCEHTSPCCCCSLLLLPRGSVCFRTFRVCCVLLQTIRREGKQRIDANSIQTAERRGERGLCCRRIAHSTALRMRRNSHAVSL